MLFRSVAVERSSWQCTSSYTSYKSVQSVGPVLASSIHYPGSLQYRIDPFLLGLRTDPCRNSRNDARNKRHTTERATEQLIP